MYSVGLHIQLVVHLSVDYYLVDLHTVVTLVDIASGF